MGSTKMTENDLESRFDSENREYLTAALILGCAVSSIMSLIGGVQTLLHGFSLRNGILLLGGLASILGSISARTLILIWIKKGHPQRSYLGWLFYLAFSIQIIYYLYILLFECMWRLLHSFSPFSFGSLFASIFYFIVGNKFGESTMLFLQVRRIIEIELKWQSIEGAES